MNVAVFLAPEDVLAELRIQDKARLIADLSAHAGHRLGIARRA